MKNIKQDLLRLKRELKVVEVKQRIKSEKRNSKQRFYDI